MKTFMSNDQKFKELVLYISQRCAEQRTYGSVKLNKILYFSDFLHYAKTGSPITGYEYQKLQNGPAPRKLVAVREQMLRDGELGLQPVAVRGGYTQKRPINLRAPRLEIFSGDEIATVDMVIEEFKTATAEAASEFSHQLIGWIAANEGETIPYCSIFVSNAPLTEAEVRRGREVARRFTTSTKAQKAARV